MDWLITIIKKFEFLLTNTLVMNSVSLISVFLPILTLIIQSVPEEKFKKKTTRKRLELTFSLSIVLVMIFLVSLSQYYKNEAETNRPSTYFMEISSGWGPDRNTYLRTTPSYFASLNSLIDHDKRGDGRNFVQIKEKDALNTEYSDVVTVKKDSKYTVLIYFENSSTAGISAEDTRLNLFLPSCIPQGGCNGINAKLTSSTSIPEKVWDGCALFNDSNETYELRYVGGSAIIHTQGLADGTLLDESTLFTSGSLIGIDSLDGEIKGEADAKYSSGYITFDVQVVDAETRFICWNSDQMILEDGRKNDTLILRYINTSPTDQNLELTFDNYANSNQIVNSIMVCNLSTKYEKQTLRVNPSSSTFLGTYSPGQCCYVFLNYVSPNNKDSDNTSISKAIVAHFSDGSMSEDSQFSQELP